MSTAADYARFTQMLLNGGALDGVRVPGRKTVDPMRSDLLGDLPKSGLLPRGYGLTFAVNRGPQATAAIGSLGEYTRGGAAGTTFRIDPQQQMAGMLMIQTMFDLGKGSLFKQLVYQAIAE
jgi:CubicO group peptidase (beta-lactamase class C family)